MPLFIRLDPASPDALHLQVYRGIIDAISEGRLGVGDWLPSTREFARDLRVGRNTVLRAIERLEAEGIVKGKVGSGLRVSRGVVAPSVESTSSIAESIAGSIAASIAGSVAGSPAGSLPRRQSAAPGGSLALPFRLGVAPTDVFPDRTWARLAAQRWRSSMNQLKLGDDPLGHAPLRRVVAEYLRTARGLVCAEDQVVITSGTHHALDLLMGVAVQRGESVWVEDPCRPEVLAVLDARGIRAVPVPVDRDGFSPALASRTGLAQMAIVTPGCHWPSGVVQSLRRRQRLVEWAHMTDALLIEDDHCSATRFVGRPMPTLFALDAGRRTVHIGSFANVVFPGLRVGYLVLPDRLRDPVAAVLRSGAQHTATSVQAILTDFIEQGFFARHLRRLRDVLAERYAALSCALSAECGGVLDPVPASGGMHVLAWLPPGFDERASVEAAAREGVEVAGVSAYCRTSTRPGLVLGFGAWDRERLVRAAAALARALESQSAAPRVVNIDARDNRAARAHM